MALESLNFDNRDASVPLQYIVLHYTGMTSAELAKQRMCDPVAEVSAHYLIDDAGKIFPVIDESKRAWHAGKSFWRGTTDMNSASIGIELHNPGHQHGYRAFAAAQIAQLKSLLHQIIERHSMTAKTCLVGHSDIAPTRKQDPGELFPWKELALHGLGVWPDVQPHDYVPTKDEDVHPLLESIGYVCPTSTDYSREGRAVLLAFQRHYFPEKLTGTPDKETVARIRAVLRQLQ